MEGASCAARVPARNTPMAKLEREEIVDDIM
jgi:hypothetical protein